MTVRRAIMRDHPDLENQHAQCLCSLRMEVGVLKRERQVTDFAAEEVRQARMQPHGRWFRAFCQKYGELLAASSSEILTVILG